MKTNPVINRRRFLVSTFMLGGGMALGVSACSSDSPENSASLGSDSDSGAELSPWIEISADDWVTVHVPQPEIGNGTMTQVAMTITEELNCDWSRIRVQPASILRNHMEDDVYSFGPQPFFGGHITESDRMEHMLQLGASARQRLIQAAAAQWDVPPGEIKAENSELVHTSSGRTMRFGQIASAAAEVELAEEPAIKPRDQWRLIGKKSFPKLHIPDIVSGKAVYGIDVQVPGMVHAAIMQSPVMGGKLKHVDASAIAEMPGVRKVVILSPDKTVGTPVPAPIPENFQPGDLILTSNPVQHGVAVIADHYWQAKKALAALPVEWEAGEGANWKNADAIYSEARKRRGKEGAIPLIDKGDIASAQGSRVVESEYGTPYCDNAAMEPLNATVRVDKDSVEAWVSTQDQLQAYWTVIDETGVLPEKVKVHTTLVGGAFGRRTQADDVRMAAAVAREYPGTAVKTIWSREETFRQGRYRTPIEAKFRAVLDDQTGLPAALSAESIYIGTNPLFQYPLGLFDVPFFNDGTIPNIRVVTNSMPVHILNGAWRGPCYNSHVFNVESFIDECAVTAGIDPLEYRLKLLANWDKSWSNCLRVAADKAGWGKTLPQGEGIGIAISCFPLAMIPQNGSVIATAVRVHVSQAGKLSIKQIDVSFDCGSYANADAVRAQVEGAVLYGLNAVMNENMSVVDGAMVEGNFDKYPVNRMADIPDVNVHFEALSGHSRMAIIGEAPTGPVQAALGNAIFAATGKRLRHTPIRGQDLSWG